MMKLRFALLMVLVLTAVFFSTAVAQHLTESNTTKIQYKALEQLTTLCNLITPHDPGSGGGGKGET